jgi:uncharacterized protein HemY
VRRDLLEATRRQLRQALELNPANTKALALLLVTHYQLGSVDALMQTLRRARERNIPSADLKAVDRCEQMIREEGSACRLPLELHAEFMAYLGL